MFSFPKIVIKAAIFLDIMAEGEFTTSVACMDSRIQIPSAKWTKENHSVDHVDTITESGVDKKIADNDDLESIRTKAGLSINAHGSSLIAVVSGHYDRARNPVYDREHITHIKKGVEAISSRELDAKAVGVWIGGPWSVNAVWNDESQTF